MRKIGVLVQEHMHDSKSKAQQRTMDALRLSAERAMDLEAATPEVQESMGDLLRKAIDDIRTTVDSKIQGGHDATQGEIDQRVDAVQAGSEGTAAKYDDAVSADELWLGCVVEEREKLQEVEEARANLTEAQDVARAAREHMEEVARFTKEAPASLPLSMTCSPGQDSGCASSLGALRATLDGYKQELAGEIGQAQQTFGAAFAAHEAAEGDVAEKEAQVSQKEESWRSQRSLCQGNAQERAQKMCSFGESLQGMCVQIQSYHDFMGLVDEADGGEYSNADRMAEWTTSHLTKCLLEKVVNGFQLDSEALAECEGTADFATDVGVLARKGEEVEQAAASDAYSCDSVQISFMGWTWDVPAEVDGISSDQYQRVEPWQPSFSVDADSQMFDFCGSS